MIEEAVLREALMGVMKYRVMNYPEPTKEDYKIAKHLRPRIKRMIEKRVSPFLYYAKRIIASIIFILCIIGVLLGFPQSVRAGLMRWFQEHFEGNSYRYQNQLEQGMEEEDITVYSLQGKVPEGYQFFERFEDEDMISEIFINENSNILCFMVMSPTYEGDILVVSDREKRTAFVGEFQADVYLSDDANESNEIAWVGNNYVLFVIQGFLSEEKLIELAEMVSGSSY